MIAVIPAFNEADAIGSVLDQLTASPLDVEAVVVDDGSTDATAEVARRHGATVLELPFNLGVGGAVRLGLRYAVDRDASRVVILDADGQHAPSDIAQLLAALDAGFDMAIGSRFVAGAGGYRMGGVRRLAHGFLNRVIRMVSGFEATDATSGFRAFERPVVELLAEHYPVEYLADTVEVILLVRQYGFTVSEVQVGMLQRQAGVPSKTTFGLLFNYGRLLVGVLGAAVSGRAKRTPTNGAST